MLQDQGELYVLLEKIQRGDQAALGYFTMQPSGAYLPSPSK